MTIHLDCEKSYLFPCLIAQPLDLSKCTSLHTLTLTFNLSHDYVSNDLKTLTFAFDAILEALNSTLQILFKLYLYLKDVPSYVADTTTHLQGLLLLT